MKIIAITKIIIITMKTITMKTITISITCLILQGNSICIPKDYSKFDLPNETRTVVNVGIDIKDIPKIDDKDFSVTLNAFFVVQWTDERLLIDQEQVRISQNESSETRSELNIQQGKNDSCILCICEFKFLERNSVFELKIKCGISTQRKGIQWCMRRWWRQKLA